jgi:transposase InsO family protein
LDVSRSHLRESLRKEPALNKKRRGKEPLISDDEILHRIKSLVSQRPSYGYRRACAAKNRALVVDGLPKANHKRIYRLMKENGLQLPKFVGFQPKRKHEGTVQTLRSNTRWCSDSFQIRCWDGRRIEAMFVIDTCEREVLSLVAAIGTLEASDVRAALALAYERCFPGNQAPKTKIEWLTDNGGIFIAKETQLFAEGLGFIPCQTPAYSPESNGMSEAFVKRFKQDYVYVNELWDAEEVLGKLSFWATDFNENHAHKSLKMISPSEFRRAN